jgi:hypothetical protein
VNFVEFVNQVQDELWRRPVRLRDVRAAAARIEEVGLRDRFERTVLGAVVRTVNKYYPLPELIALYHREIAVYYEHIRRGDFDDSNEKNVISEQIYGLCCWWLKPYRYPYGDVRLLRPLIGEVLIASAEWSRSPYPDQSAALGQWYEELAPDGALYPSEEHLDYVRRFEAFAEDIVWDSRGREHLTIVNFPAPPNPVPPEVWWCTQHVLPADHPPKRLK